MRRGRVTAFGAAAVLALGVFLLVASAFRSGPAGPCVVAGANGPAMVPEIPEASGLAISRRNPGLLWSHNDSGNATVLFAVDPAGTVRGRVRVPVRTRDWEDISAGRCADRDCLYIADIGDNGLARRRIQIIRVPEPAARDAETAPPEIFQASYADGRHNAEALFVVGADLFIITRDRTGGVYRATVPSSGGGELTFERVGEVGLEVVSDAEASRDEQSVVVRNSHQAVLYRAADLIRGRSVPYLLIPLDGLREAQGEGVALDGSTIYLASEGRPWNRAGRILGLRCDASVVTPPGR